MRWIFIALLLGGCVSPEQAARNRAAAAEQQRQAEIAYTQGLFAQCRSIGFSDGSDGQRNCVLQLHQQNQANRAALGAALLQGQMANQPRATQCAKDYLGRVNCVSR
jgi:hypothetical protein